jgi:pimeloyl-ACP methyl ester carboxylesterase
VPGDPRIASGVAGGARDRTAGRPWAPAPDPDVEPESLIVTLDTGDRVHELDWGGPADRRWAARDLPPVLLVHGLRGTAWDWAPVARRLRTVTRVLAADLRGHGLSDAPAGGYDLESLAIDLLTILVAHGFGPDAPGPPAVIVGHGFGGMAAVGVTVTRPGAVAGLGLVDGGWQDVDAAGQDIDGYLRAIAEPPEVLRSMEAWLADRRAFDPATWDRDGERAARAAVVETHAGHVVPVTRRHALAGCVGTMLGYRAATLLPRIQAPVLLAVPDDAAPDDDGARDRARAIDEAFASLRFAPGRPAGAGVRVARYPGAGHNLARYRPDELAADVLALLEEGAAGD